jgi:hypothetical protein
MCTALAQQVSNLLSVHRSWIFLEQLASAQRLSSPPS